jgi:hypothetical protein
MVSMALWVLEIEVENAVVMLDDEVEMQEKCLSADERQSTIRQSGGGDNGVWVVMIDHRPNGQKQGL